MDATPLRQPCQATHTLPLPSVVNFTSPKAEIALGGRESKLAALGHCVGVDDEAVGNNSRHRRIYEIIQLWRVRRDVKRIGGDVIGGLQPNPRGCMGQPV
jgi:hypothetical protein